MSRRHVWTRWTLAAVVMAVAGVAAHLADRAVLEALHKPTMARNDWYALLRTAGDIRLWLVVGACLALGNRSASGLRTALSVVLAAVLAGAGAEVLKLIVGRERPVSDGVIQHAGAYVWKPGVFDAIPGFLGGFADSSNLGMPSSHAAVAFGGCVALGERWPATRLALLPVAAGCALTRLFTGAHFLSDVLVGALLGGVIGLALSGSLAGLPRSRRGGTIGRGAMAR